MSDAWNELNVEWQRTCVDAKEAASAEMDAIADFLSTLNGGDHERALSRWKAAEIRVKEIEELQRDLRARIRGLP